MQHRLSINNAERSFTLPFTFERKLVLNGAHTRNQVIKPIAWTIHGVVLSRIYFGPDGRELT